ncbi:hypothetical protein HanHA89_Chr15g0603181 [Helianthus annuus]|nr:hypothetical protein HanHA89_Chr15g0603181 [Helianthus annuus]
MRSSGPIKELPNLSCLPLSFCFIHNCQTHVISLVYNHNSNRIFHIISHNQQSLSTNQIYIQSSLKHKPRSQTPIGYIQVRVIHVIRVCDTNQLADKTRGGREINSKSKIAAANYKRVC